MEQTIRIGKLNQKETVYDTSLAKKIIEGNFTKLVPQDFENVTKLRGHLFYNCDNLVSVEFSDSIKEIASSCFSGCSNLSDVIFSENLETLGRSVFSSTPITSITLPSKIKYLDYDLFYNCTSLKKIILPAGLEKIHYYAFDGCKSLDTIIFKGTKTQWNNIVFETSGTASWNTDIPATTVQCSDGIITI